MTLNYPDLISVVEFGATARGDADVHSDRDIFILAEDAEPSRLIALRQEVASALGVRDVTTVTCFTTSTMDHMIDFGSLFLWHLKLEGRILNDSDGVAQEALHRLRPYRWFRKDLERFRDVFEDVRLSLEEFGNLNSFESHVLFGVIRNTCMLLTVKANSPSFGRATVFSEARALFPTLPLSEQTIRTLEQGHLVYHRGAEIAWVDIVEGRASAILNEIDRMLVFGFRVCCD